MVVNSNKFPPESDFLHKLQLKILWPKKKKKEDEGKVLASYCKILLDVLDRENSSERIQ